MVSARLEYKLEDITNLELPENTFDRVYCISVLEHLEEARVNGRPVNNHLKNLEIAAINELLRVLKPGGSLIVGFIDRDSPLGRQYAARQDRDPFYRHARFYSVEEVSCQLQQSGFGKPVASQTILCSPDSMSNEQPVKSGHGEGSFVVLKATKQTAQKRRH
jgi:SAM-dependent methyltransferase